nr:hypothetical protein [Mariprofundus ferrooxydans]
MLTCHRNLYGKGQNYIACSGNGLGQFCIATGFIGPVFQIREKSVVGMTAPQILLQNIVYHCIAMIFFGFGKEYVHADGFGSGFGTLANQLRDLLSWPRPSTYAGNTLFINADNNDFIADGTLTAQQKTEVEGFVFHELDKKRRLNDKQGCNKENCPGDN